MTKFNRVKYIKEKLAVYGEGKVTVGRLGTVSVDTRVLAQTPEFQKSLKAAKKIKLHNKSDKQAYCGN